MSRPLTSAKAAEESGRHPETIRKAVRAQELHGTQRTKGGSWFIRPECLDAWIDGVPCAHQAAAANVESLDARRAARAGRGA